MKLVLKCILYPLVIAASIVAMVLIYNTHPEAQFIFIFPGVLVFVISVINDDIKNIRRLSSKLGPKEI